MHYTVYKQLGETPLETLERCRMEKDIDKGTAMTYAGRLDPLAEGVMIVLSGDDVHRKGEFISLDKVYELEILWGVSTDTYDLLGMPEESRSSTAPDRAEVAEELKRWETIFEQPYPPYSSKSVDGKPLWKWAREGRLDEIDAPTREVEIYRIEDHKRRKLKVRELLETVNERLSLASGDFRQAEIRDAWTRLLKGREEKEYTRQKLTVECSSGTYMRSLAHNLGKTLGITACAFAIKRTRIATYTA